MQHRGATAADRPSRAGLAAFGALFLALAAAFAGALAEAEPDAGWLAAGTGGAAHVRP